MNKIKREELKIRNEKKKHKRRMSEGTRQRQRMWKKESNH